MFASVFVINGLNFKRMDVQIMGMFDSGTNLLSKLLTFFGTSLSLVLLLIFPLLLELTVHDLVLQLVSGLL